MTNQFASLCNVTTLATVLVVGVTWGALPGAVIGASAFVAGFAAEAALLYWRSAQLRGQLSGVSLGPQPGAVPTSGSASG